MEKELLEQVVNELQAIRALLAVSLSSDAFSAAEQLLRKFQRTTEEKAQSQSFSVWWNDPHTRGMRQDLERVKSMLPKEVLDQLDQEAV